MTDERRYAIVIMQEEDREFAQRHQKLLRLRLGCVAEVYDASNNFEHTVGAARDWVLAGAGGVLILALSKEPVASEQREERKRFLEEVADSRITLCVMIDPLPPGEIVFLPRGITPALFHGF